MTINKRKDLKKVMADSVTVESEGQIDKKEIETETEETEQNAETEEKCFSNDLPIRDILRHVRESLVELFVAIAKTLFFWVPGGDVAKGKALMACHPIFLACVTALFFIVDPKSPLRFIIVALAFITVGSQWLLGGCVITRAEQRLTGSKETILDPFLILAKISVNRDTRIAGTIGAGTAVCVMLVWAFLCDMWFRR
jgi:hypothetical protein